MAIEVNSITVVSTIYGQLSYKIGDTSISVTLTPAEAATIFAVAEGFVRDRQAALAAELATAPVGLSLTGPVDADFTEVLV